MSAQAAPRIESKPLHVVVAEALGWRAWAVTTSAGTRCDFQRPGAPEPWMVLAPAMREQEQERYREVQLEEAERLDAGLPRYGMDVPAGRALAVEMMQSHRIGVQPSGPHMGYRDAHWEGYVIDAADPERVWSACGSTIPEAVVRCFLAMREARPQGAL